MVVFIGYDSVLREDLGAARVLSAVVAGLCDFFFFFTFAGLITPLKLWREGRFFEGGVGGVFRMFLKSWCVEGL